MHGLLSPAELDAALTTAAGLASLATQPKLQSLVAQLLINHTDSVHDFGRFTVDVAPHELQPLQHGGSEVAFEQGGTGELGLIDTSRSYDIIGADHRLARHDGRPGPPPPEHARPVPGGQRALFLVYSCCILLFQFLQSGPRCKTRLNLVLHRVVLVIRMRWRFEL